MRLDRVQLAPWFFVKKGEHLPLVSGQESQSQSIAMDDLQFSTRLTRKTACLTPKISLKSLVRRYEL